MSLILIYYVYCMHCVRKVRMHTLNRIGQTCKGYEIKT